MTNGACNRYEQFIRPDFISIKNVKRGLAESQETLVVDVSLVEVDNSQVAVRR